MTSHCNSHTTTDVQPEMILGVQTGIGIPHDKYNMRSIVHARARTNRKDENFMQRRLLLERFRDSALSYTTVAVIFFTITETGLKGHKGKKY